MGLSKRKWPSSREINFLLAHSFILRGIMKGGHDRYIQYRMSYMSIMNLIQQEEVMFREKCKFASLSAMLIIILILFVSGCATTKPQTQSSNLAQESIAFMTLKVSNQFKPNYQPFVDFMTVLKDNGGRLTFTVDKPYNKIENQFNEYLIIINLSAGSYKIGCMHGQSRQIIFGSKQSNNPLGYFYAPIFSDFELKQNNVVYLGHIEATVNERKNKGDAKAGPPTPVLDQITTGFLLGTFDIKIMDNFDEDVAIFKQKYSLPNSSVEKTILPPWKKPTDEDLYNYNLSGMKK
jgi:hypothetical protein